MLLKVVILADDVNLVKNVLFLKKTKTQNVKKHHFVVFRVFTGVLKVH